MYLCKEDRNQCSSILLLSIKEATCHNRVFPLKGFLSGLETDNQHNNVS